MVWESSPILDGLFQSLVSDAGVNRFHLDFLEAAGKVGLVMELRCYSNAVHKNTAAPTCKLQLLVALRCGG